MTTSIRARQKYLTHMQVRVHPTLTEGAVSRTQQADKDQTDVNAIVARFDRTGQLPINNQKPQYADVTELQRDLTTQIQESRDNIAALENYQADLNQLQEHQQHRDQIASEIPETPPEKPPEEPPE